MAPSMYKQLVARLGEDGARAEMKRRRSFVKHPGLANVDKQKLKEISKKGVEARNEIRTSPKRSQEAES